MNVWIDEYGVGSDSQSGAGNDNDIPKDLIKAQEWISQFCSKEAQEVRDVLGAVIFTLDSNSQIKKEDLDCLIQFIDKLDNELWDGSGLVVSRRDISEELKDYLFDQGLEFIYLGHEENDDDKNKKNEFGEKQGIERIREVLEMVPWDNSQQEVNNEEEVLEKQCRNNSNEKEHETRQIVNSLFLSQGYEKPIFSQGAFGTNTSEEEQVDALETFMDKLKSIKGLCVYVCFVNISDSRANQIMAVH